jgi:hypothetical protein
MRNWSHCDRDSSRVALGREFAPKQVATVMRLQCFPAILFHIALYLPGLSWLR